MPWSENIEKNIVKTNPTLHLNKLDINDENLSNLMLSDKLDIIPKIKLNMKSGRTKKLKKSATYVDIIATIGLKAPAEAWAPSPIISVSKIGNNVFICETILPIANCVDFVIFETIPIIKVATDKKHTKLIKFPVDLSLNLLFTPFNRLLTTPMAIIKDKIGIYFATNSIKLENKLARKCW